MSAEERAGLPPLEELEERLRKDILLVYEEKVRKLKAEYERALEEIGGRYEKAAKGFAERASP